MQRDAISVSGVSNFRDFGGYRTLDGHFVPEGRLYRSAHLGRIDDAGFARLADMGIATVVDLRGREERLKALPAGGRIRIVSAPVEPGAFTSMVLPDGRTVTADLMREQIHRIYRRFATEVAHDFGAALRSVLESADRPLLVHCTAGKDRTGFLVALVQSILGVSREEVVADYLLTNTHWDRAYDGKLDFPADVMAPALAADAAYLDVSLAALAERFGSVEEYAAEATGDPGFARALRAAILVRPEAAR